MKTPGLGFRSRVLGFRVSSPFCIWMKSDTRATCRAGCRCKRCWLCPGIGWRPSVIKTSRCASASFDNHGSSKVMAKVTRLSNKLLEWTPKGKEEEEEEAAATCSDTRSRRRVGGGTKQIRQVNCYNSWWEWSFFSGGQVFHPDNPKVSKYLKVD